MKLFIITTSLNFIRITSSETNGLTGTIASIHDDICCKIRNASPQLHRVHRSSGSNGVLAHEFEENPFLNSILGKSKSCIKQIRRFNSASIRTCEKTAKEMNLYLIGRGGSTTSKRRRNNTGFYYGLRDDIFFPLQENKGQKEESNNLKNGMKKKNHGVEADTLADVMSETLSELREMREDIMALREEMQYMKEEFKRSKSRFSYEEEEDDDEGESGAIGSFVQRVKRQRRYDVLGNEIERWAHKLLFEEDGEEFGWKEVKCNKMMRKRLNPYGHTTCYLKVRNVTFMTVCAASEIVLILFFVISAWKWLKDPRGEYTSGEDNGQEYPCIKCFATIDSPIEDVCKYLSNESHVPEYNDLVISYRDLEDISPTTKITWSKCPQILFIKPRDFVTFCHHRYRKDGTQIVVNQACEHDSAPRNDIEEDGKVCRASAIRGANCKCSLGFECFSFKNAH